MKRFHGLALATGLALIPTLLVWLPFFLRMEYVWGIPLPQEGLATIVSNYDGPLYIVVAKSLYNPEVIKSIFSFDLPAEYYAAHFPLFPLFIKLGGFITTHPYAMLTITLIGSILTLWYFYKLVSQYTDPPNAVWLTAMFSVFPARWLIVRSVGSPEPLFIAAIIASIFYFQKSKYWLAAFWGVVAQLTKSPGILLFIAYAGYIAATEFNRLENTRFGSWIKSISLRPYPILLIPLSLFAIFVFYKYTMNDFLAYFHSGDNIHLLFPPFQIFNYQASWVNTHWLEEIIFIYLISFYGLIKLILDKKQVMAWFVGVFFVSLLFVSHRDLMRYSLPVVPFLYVAYRDLLTKTEFKWAFALIIIPIYLFSLAFISRNVMPISNWSSLL